MRHPTFGATVVLLAFLALSRSSALWAAEDTGVSPGPHQLTLGAEFGVVGSVGFDGDGHHEEGGTLEGTSLGYTYRALSWLEVGGRFDYARTTGPFFTDRLFLGPQLRASLGLTQERSIELGATLVGGLLELEFPDIEDSDLWTEHDHRFLGWQAMAAGDLRFRFDEHVSLAIANQWSLGYSWDMVSVDGYYMGSSGVLVAISGLALVGMTL